MRRAAKTDSTQKQIVATLRAVGVHVEIIKQPVDLLLKFWSNKHQSFIWMPAECKPKKRKRQDQPVQSQFIQENDIPVFRSSLDALEFLVPYGHGRRHLAEQALAELEKP